MKKILLFGSFPPPYHGSSIYLQNLHDLLFMKKEFDVIKVNSTKKPKDLNDLGNWTFTNFSNALRSLLELLFKLITNNVDVVYIPIAQNKSAFLRDGIAILISKFLGKKVLIHLNGSYFLEFYNKCKIMYKLFINYSMKKVDGAIVLGGKLKYIFKTWLDDRRIFVLPNFIKVSASTSIQNTNEKKNFVTLIYLGNLIKSKGIFELISVSEILHKYNFKIELLIVGNPTKDPFTGTSEEEMKGLIQQKVKENNFIKFIGAITDNHSKFELLSKSDIFVLPSWNEGQPLSILEAMSVGLPIISTKDCGVIDETVIDGYNGILVEKRNVHQLAEAIKKLLMDEDLRKKMSENSRKRYLELYTPEKHYELFKEILINI